MDELLRRETEKLTRSWMQHDQVMLRDYLVRDVEDPRLNVQSVLTRHFLLVTLFGERFAALLEEELRFALAMNWLRNISGDLESEEERAALRHALGQGADSAEGLPIPRFLLRTYAALPAAIRLPATEPSAGVEAAPEGFVPGRTHLPPAEGDLWVPEENWRPQTVLIPNYVDQALETALGGTQDPFPSEPVLSTFQRIWREKLESEAPAGLRILEPACGSANDYRYFDAFGLARLVDYTGFDLCEKNVRNARAMFPRTGFAVANVFAIPSPDRAYDLCVVQDLFEHLSLTGLDQALREICRVTRQSLGLGFFSLHEDEDHIVRPVDDYHCNVLSLPRLRAALERSGFEVQITHIDTFLKWRFGCAETHNRNAYTLFATRVR